MITVHNIIAELSHMTEWVLTQIGCGLDGDSCAKHQYESLMGKIQSLTSVEVAEATELCEAIRAYALDQWAPTQIAELRAAVGSKTGLLNKGPGDRKQKMTTFAQFMTHSEINSLKDGMLSEKAMIQVVTKRAHKLGMHTLTEGSKGAIAAVIASVMQIDTGTDRWLKLLDKVKKALRQFKPKDWKYRTIWEYDKVEDISGEPWFDEAYPDEPPSGSQHWEVEEPDCVRSSHNRIRKKTSASEVATPKAPPVPPPDVGAYHALFGHGLVSALFSAAAAQHSQRDDATAGSQWWSPGGALAPRPKAHAPPAAADTKCAVTAKAMAKAVPKAAHAGPPAHAAAAEPTHEPEQAAAADDPSLSDEESKLRRAIADRIALKRPAKADGGVPEDAEDDVDDPVNRKRPAAADGGPPMKAAKQAKVVMKKPMAKPAVLPKAPTSDSGPLHYRAGYVSTSFEQSTYRAVMGRSDKRFKWGGWTDRTRQQSFKCALEWLDEKS